MRQDIITNDQNEIEITNGDFAIGASDTQHVSHLVIAQQGEYKAHPRAGFGAEKYLKADVVYVEEKFKRDLKIQLEQDGYNNAEIDLSQGFEFLKIKL